MYQRHRVTRLASLVLPALLVATGAGAQQIKGRVMVLVDTSGSMIWHFGDNFTAGGDGDQNSLFTDSVQVGKNYYPGTLVNGTWSGTTSRLYAAKRAVTNVIYGASGIIDFGLMRFIAGPVNKQNCDSATNCCTFT